MAVSYAERAWKERLALKKTQFLKSRIEEGVASSRLKELQRGDFRQRAEKVVGRAKSEKATLYRPATQHQRVFARGEGSPQDRARALQIRHRKAIQRQTEAKGERAKKSRQFKRQQAYLRGRYTGGFAGTAYRESTRAERAGQHAEFRQRAVKAYSSYAPGRRISSSRRLSAMLGP